MRKTAGFLCLLACVFIVGGMAQDSIPIVLAGVWGVIFSVKQFK